jgi:hypothetical protein
MNTVAVEPDVEVVETRVWGEGPGYEEVVEWGGYYR